MKHPRTGQPEIGRDKQALDLHVAFVAQRKDCPVGIGTFGDRDDFDAADDAVFAGCGADLNAAVLARQDVERRTEIDRIDPLGDRDDLEGHRPSRQSGQCRKQHG